MAQSRKKMHQEKRKTKCAYLGCQKKGKYWDNAV